MDWLIKVLKDYDDCLNCQASRDELASAIREEIRKRRPSNKYKGDKSDCERYAEALADYDKTLGIKEAK